MKSRPKRIILIRHGESEGNVDRRTYGYKPDYALELSLKGFAQAMEAGKELKNIIKDENAFFYVSPMWRTRMTFEQISKAFDKEKIQYIEEPRLREQEWGHLRDEVENENIDKQRDAYGTFYFRIPDGESAADVYDRVSDFFGTMHRDFQKENFPENVVIVTHGMTIRLFLMKWFHWTVEEFESYSNPKNCQITVLERNDTQAKFKLISELTRHKVRHPYQRPIEI